jgi:predicted nucleic acid-binding protein
VDLIADTSYLVGLWRGQTWATAYAYANSEKSIGLPWVVLGEFWHGAAVAQHDSADVTAFLSIGVHVVDAGPVVPAYSQICAKLSQSADYRKISQNDLWIASVAVALKKPLLTRNVRHFDLIEGLVLEVLER